MDRNGRDPETLKARLQMADDAATGHQPSSRDTTLTSLHTGDVAPSETTGAGARASIDYGPMGPRADESTESDVDFLFADPSFDPATGAPTKPMVAVDDPTPTWATDSTGPTTLPDLGPDGSGGFAVEQPGAATTDSNPARDAQHGKAPDDLALSEVTSPDPADTQKSVQAQTVKEDAAPAASPTDAPTIAATPPPAPHTEPGNSPDATATDARARSVADEHVIAADVDIDLEIGGAPVEVIASGPVLPTQSGSVEAGLPDVNSAPSLSFTAATLSGNATLTVRFGGAHSEGISPYEIIVDGQSVHVGKVDWASVRGSDPGREDVEWHEVTIEVPLGTSGIGEIGVRFQSDLQDGDESRDHALVIDQIVIDGHVMEAQGSGVAYRTQTAEPGTEAAKSYGTIAFDTSALDLAPRATIAENAPGAVVGQIEVSDSDAGETFTYTVSDDRFEVVGGSVKLRDGVSLNHEEAAGLDLRVEVTDLGGLTAVQEIRVNVADLNDAPTDITLDSASVSEAEAGAVVGRLDAADEDGGAMTWQVSDDRFEVVEGQLRLRSGETLDHEAAATIAVDVTATDAGGLSRTETFQIDVTDVNEAPVIGFDAVAVEQTARLTVRLGGEAFEGNPEYEILVDGVVVSRGAVDWTTQQGVHDNPEDIEWRDISLDVPRGAEGIGEVEVRFLEDGWGGSFDKDRNLLIDRIEIDGQRMEAEGPGVTYRSPEGSGANDGERVWGAASSLAFDTTGLDTAPRPTIAENAAGAVVGRLQVADPDAGDAHVLTVSDDRFEIVDGELRLVDELSLNYEDGARVSVDVTATDSGGLTHVRTVDIAVADVNEAPDIAFTPMLDRETVPLTVRLDGESFQGNPAYEIVVDGRVVHADEVHWAKPGDIDYSMDNVDWRDITIEVPASADGLGTVEVRFTNNLYDGDGTRNRDLLVDRIVLDGHVMQAEGPGTEYRSDHFGVVPGRERIGAQGTLMFDTGHLDLAPRLSLPENQAGAIVGRIDVSDQYAHEALTVTVSDSRFEVLDGHLKLREGVALDHEAADAVSVDVTVVDAGGLSRSHTVEIAVSDVNEAPNALHLSAVPIEENAEGAVVGQLGFDDPDDGDRIAYTVSDDRFEVVGDQLRLRAGEALDHEAASTVSVDVTATDAGGLTRTETFEVEVLDVNEAPEVGFAPENGGDTAVLTVRLGGENFEGNPRYQITVDGKVVHSGEVDWSSQQGKHDDMADVEWRDVTLKVPRGADGIGEVGVRFTNDHWGGNAATDRNLLIDRIVLDGHVMEAEGSGVSRGRSGVGERMSHTETFKFDTSTIDLAPSTTIGENLAGAVVGRIDVSDQDAGETFTYTVSDDRFEVAGGSVKLRDGVSLNHEEAAGLDLRVEVTDLGGLTAVQEIRVNVADLNDAPTDITLDSASVSEAEAGAVVGRLDAADEDGGAMTWQVSDDRFEVVEGQLRLRSGETLDHEAAATIAVDVTATDAGGLSRTETFQIDVTDVNEAPVIGFDAVAVEQTARLTVRLGGEAFEGNPEYEILVDGVVVSRGAVDWTTQQGVHDNPEDIEWRDISLDVPRGAEGIGEVEVRFLEDGWGGSFDKDRNLLIDRIEIDGQRMEAEGPGVTYRSPEGSGANDGERVWGAASSLAFDTTGLDTAPRPTIAENAAGAVVGRLQVADPDAGDAHVLTVSDDRFEIVDGELRLVDELSLNYEDGARVSVDVTATDSGGLTHVRTVDIAVADVNEAFEVGFVPEAVSDTATLTVRLGGEAYQGNPRYEVVVDGQVIGSGEVDWATQEGVHDNMAEVHWRDVTFDVPRPDDGQIGTVDIRYTNNLYGGTRTTDRNLLVDRIEIDGNVLEAEGGQADYHRKGGTRAGQERMSVDGTLRFDTSDLDLSSVPTVAENEVGAVVGRLKLTDPDAGEFFTYTVSDTRFEVVGDAVKLRDGVSLNHEEASKVEFQVEITDSADIPPSRT